MTYNILHALGEGLPESAVPDAISGLDGGFAPQDGIERAMMAQVLFELLTMNMRSS
jgi:hypothetical protein